MREMLGCVRLAATLLLTVTGACDRGVANDAQRPPAPVTGQWIWSASDSAVLARGRSTVPDLRAGVWVATIDWRGSAAAAALATSLGRPLDATVGHDAELVIRLEHSINESWRALPADSVAARLDERLGRVLRVVERGGPRHTVQLDYDAPVSRLADYAALLERLRRPGRSLAGRSLWITSLVAHLADPDYGKRFGPLVDGHIVQLFDTGDGYTPERAREVMARLNRAAIPFRLGLGAFERRLASGPTTHRAWFDIIPTAARSPWYRGMWIFPGGVDYQTYLPR
ncbi:MAG: hypothetical protein IT359_11630 [Gemmatimonadaceae bacterium]|nr:hypothetical protein [Gemmatimonadaceae bacterium]